MENKMRDYLLDIVQNTYGLGVIGLIKISGTEDKTTINAYDKENKTVVISGEFKSPHPDFIGTFGMPNLDRLNTILGIPEYKEDAKITVTRENDAPGGISFENKSGDFKNNYRFMQAAMVNQFLPDASMKPVKWGVDIVPSVASIQKLKFQSSAHSDANSFSARVDNGDLKFYFGDPSSHAGSFVFAAGCGGTLTKPLFLPTAVVNNIFSLAGDKTFKASDSGVAEITVDTGLTLYRYLIPSQSK
jgi:hypothetical protein